MPKSLSRLPAPHAHRARTSTTTSTTSASATGSASRRGVEHAARGADGVWEVDARRRRDARATTRCSSPTATTGTRAGPSRRSPARTTFEGVQMHSHDYVDNPIFARQERRRARDGQLRDGHRGRGVATSPSDTYLAARRGAWIIPKYLFGTPDRPARDDPRDPVRGPPADHPGDAARSTSGDMERYGLPKPDHQLRRGAPDDLRTTSSTASPTATITPKPNIARARRATRVVLRRRQRGARPTSSSTAPATRSRSRSSTRTSSRRPTTTCRCSGASSTPTSPNVVLHRAAAAARRDHAARRGAGRSGSATTCAASTRCRRAARAARRHRATSARRCSSATSPPSATRCRSTSTTTCTTLAQERKARRASAPARPGFALPVPRARRRAARGRRVTRRRRRRRQARGDQGRQPRGDPRRGARGLRRARLRRGERARHRPPHRPRVGHVLQLLPRQGVGASARSSTRSRAEVRGARARRARAARRRSRTFVARRLTARTSPSSSRTALTFELLRRNAGHDPRDVRRAVARRGHRRAARRPARRRSPPGCCPPHDAELHGRRDGRRRASRSASACSTAASPTSRPRSRSRRRSSSPGLERLGTAERRERSSERPFLDWRVPSVLPPQPPRVQLPDLLARAAPTGRRPRPRAAPRAAPRRGTSASARSAAGAAARRGPASCAAWRASADDGFDIRPRPGPARDAPTRSCSPRSWRFAAARLDELAARAAGPLARGRTRPRAPPRRRSGWPS